LVYGVRPEKLILVPQGGIPARVAIVEPMGSETQVTIRTQEQDLTILLRERFVLCPGETINLAVNAADVHLFDAATDQRIE
jgi:multiple sugar transport system ATP-binding protein